MCAPTTRWRRFLIKEDDSSVARFHSGGVRNGLVTVAAISRFRPVTAEELETIVNPACVLMNVRASNFDECLAAFGPLVHGHPAIVDPGMFMESVRAREAAVSTATEDHVAFPHARTEAVSRLFLVIGRSETGVSFGPDRPVVHLVFLIGAPPHAITDYLGCVAWLAKRVRIPENRKILMHAESPEAFLRIIAAASS